MKYKNNIDTKKLTKELSSTREIVIKIRSSLNTMLDNMDHLIDLFDEVILEVKNSKYEN